MLITTEAIGADGADAVIRRSDLAAYGFKKGHILGSEVAGTVTAVAAASARHGSAVAYGRSPVQAAATPNKRSPQPDGSSLSLRNLSVASAVTLGSSGVVADFGL